MNRLIRHAAGLCALALGALATSASLFAGPVPVGSSDIFVRYQSDGDPITLTGPRNYDGTSPGDATLLGANVKEFNSANGFGRRIAVAITFPEVIGDNETLIAHNFFKSDISQPFFPGIAADGMITFEVDSVVFNEPVFVDESTVVFHTLWDPDQIREGLPHHDPYEHAHNIHTLTDPFRDMDKFEAVHEMNDHHDHMLGDMAGRIIITGEGTSTLHFMAEVPHEMLKHLGDEGQEVMEGFPAPHGFLEPFHFHFEYIVTTVPEPAALLLLAAIAPLAAARRRRTV